MVYEDVQYTDDEKDAKKRRLRMEQMTFEGDERKLRRDIESSEREAKQLTVEKQRLVVLTAAQEHKHAALEEKHAFLKEELRKIKKLLIRLG